MLIKILLQKLPIQLLRKQYCILKKYIYKRFDDRYLAFAAYNTGEGRIDRHIKYFKTRNFWELKNLPKETQNYIPSVMAIIFISKDPEKYGFTIKSEESFDWDIKVIDKSVKQFKTEVITKSFPTKKNSY